MHPASFPTRSLLRSRESARAGDRVAAAPRRDSMKSCINGGPQTVCVCVCVTDLFATLDRAISFSQSNVRSSIVDVG